MRVYHFIPARWALQNIKRRRLKIATYANLNDPFEGRAVAIRDRAARRGFASAREAWGEMFGLLCFSQSWQNPVQWSHYAERHTGLCLGFDIPNQHAVEVDYKARPYPESTLDDLDSLPLPKAQELMERLLATKFINWRYEQEVRRFTDLTDRDPATGLYFMPFGPELVLAEVIVGYQSTVTRKQLAAALGPLAASVSTRKARLSFQTFRVVAQHDPAMWP